MGEISYQNVHEINLKIQLVNLHARCLSIISFTDRRFFQSSFGVGRQDSKPVGIVVSLKEMIIAMALQHIVVVNALKVKKFT